MTQADKLLGEILDDWDRSGWGYNPTTKRRVEKYLEYVSNLVEARVSPACEWLEVDEDEGVTYETDCENKFVCGEWEELYKTFEYCIYCGGKIKVKKSKNF